MTPTSRCIMPKSAFCQSYISFFVNTFSLKKAPSTRISVNVQMQTHSDAASSSMSFPQQITILVLRGCLDFNWMRKVDNSHSLSFSLSFSLRFLSLFLSHFTSSRAHTCLHGIVSLHTLHTFSMHNENTWMNEKYISFTCALPSDAFWSTYSTYFQATRAPKHKNNK